MEVLQAHATTDWVSSENIEKALIAKLGLEFPSAAIRREWNRRSFRRALQRLAHDGTAERLHDLDVPDNKHGYWRLKQAPSQRLADL